MKNYYQRLLETPVEVLDKMIVRQKAEIAILQRDLEWMERARAVQAEQQAMADIERQLGIKRAREAQTTVDGLMSIKDEHQKPEESGSIDNYSAAAWK